MIESLSLIILEARCSGCIGNFQDFNYWLEYGMVVETGVFFEIPHKSVNDYKIYLYSLEDQLR